MNEDLTILVVDDEEYIRDIFKAYFETATDYTVYTAGDGLEALDIIEKENIDCCFTDLSMPRLDGLELTRRIHLIDNTIPVVVMTGYPTMNNAIETLKNGVVDFLTKPFKIDQILPTIKRVMAERSLFVENILLRKEAEQGRKLLKVNQELQQKIKEIGTLNLILQKLNRVTSSKDLFNMLVNLSGEVTACDEAHFCFFTQEMKEHAVIASFFRDEDKTSGDAGRIENKIVKKVADDGMPCLIRGNNGDSSIMGIPLKIRSKLFGILMLVIRNGRCSFSEKDIYFLNFLAEKAAFLVENLALYENIYENLFSTLYAFVEAIEARDPYTKQHSTMVSKYAMLIAGAYGCSQEEIDKLNVAGNLHDIGKIGIPDSILLKPGRLTEEEFEVIKKHPLIGSNIIGHLGMWTDEERIIRHHHERYDGDGYPDRLKGQEIPLLSRILSVADVFDALTTDRAYRKKMADDIAVNIIKENSGSQFDPEIAGVFLELYYHGKLNPNVL
uniref:Response regulator n=1 Tax=Candidatus Desulfatibia profunda TaxID=2841695 RepID=A0A8J6NT18_9BACT|nr:response regulator [Candidatus Desulfatibia profunda]